MPAKNSVKQYVKGGYYHIYNRGVEKRNIFGDQQDYAVFVSYLREYLTPKETDTLMRKLAEAAPEEKDRALRKLRLNNFSEEIALLAYCLMPNHFHFLIKQTGKISIDKFMNSLLTRYTMYFNKKYKRVGPLFQGVYKAVLVASDEQLLHLSRYIHKQALDSYHLAGQDWLYSLPEYLGERQTAWVKPLEFKDLNYRQFVLQKDEQALFRTAQNEKVGVEVIEKLLIEKD